MQLISFTLDMIMVTSLKFMIILPIFFNSKKKNNKLRKAITDGKPKYIHFNSFEFLFHFTKAFRILLCVQFFVLIIN